MGNTRQVTAVSPPNIALVKYWGKVGAPGLNLPAGESVAVCLDRLHARVSIEPVASRGAEFYWNGVLLPHDATEPFRRVLSALGWEPGRSGMRVEVVFPLPARAGFAASAASLSAFAAAASRYLGGPEDRVSLSRLARLGSGSACRSVPGGFVYWSRGERPSGEESFGQQFAAPGHWPELRLLLVELSAVPKSVSSTEGMIQTAATSPLYDDWPARCDRHAIQMRDAICGHDFASMADCASMNWQLMHAVCLAARPPILYLNGKSAAVMDLVAELAAEVAVFVTFDAGPNPVVVTLARHEGEVASALSRVVSGAAVHSCGVGVGTTICEGGEDEPDS